ncbi:MAG: ABC transporter ATP-binding protein [Actinobacteria bacterium]|nr:ABC transporter ATP-binding protein [Actinomycetota bacterium]
MSQAAAVAISVENVRKEFGKVQAVRGVTLDIYEGEFFSMLGPSGCGKTTTLRMIAGFEEPDEGRILLRDADVTGVPPNRRNVNMVFQHYALFPHMSIYDNVAFGLKVKKVPKNDQREWVHEMLRVVQLEGMEKRRPRQLSGGQQQRVALARALVNRPAALLLDEPLGALDVKLRKQMQLELKRIQHELGTTFVYVTHDQEEAMSMSDRIAVMNGGLVEQIGGPREIYESPASAFVADFVGLLNVIDFRVDRLDGGLAAMEVGGDQRLMVPVGPEVVVGDGLRVAVRPERIRLDPPGARVPDGVSRLEGVIAQVIYLGTLTQYHVDAGPGIRLVSHRLNDESAEGFLPGSRVFLSWGSEYATVLLPAPGAEPAAAQVAGISS